MRTCFLENLMINDAFSSKMKTLRHMMIADIECFSRESDSIRLACSINAVILLIRLLMASLTTFAQVEFYRIP